MGRVLGLIAAALVFFLAALGLAVYFTRDEDNLTLRVPGDGRVHAAVALDDLPDWLPAWCLDRLGSEPVGVLFRLQQASMVFGLRLADGRDVVVKARADDGRAVSCVAGAAGRARVSVCPAAHARGRYRFAGCARRGVPARR